MSFVRKLTLSSALVGSLLTGFSSAEDTSSEPGRIYFGTTDDCAIGVGLDLEVVWTAALLAPTSVPIDLSTDVTVRVGQFTETRTVRVTVDPGSGVCSDNNYGQTCGTGLVDGQPVELTCLAEGDGYCQFPWIVTEFPVIPESMFTPGDQIFVTLTPTPGAVPEADTSDDSGVEIAGSPIFYDRSFDTVELQPVPGTADVYDIVLGYRQAYNTAIPPVDLRTDIVMERNGETTTFETWCGPWLISPETGCGTTCLDQTCAKISCGGQTVAEMFCGPVENAYGQFDCVCASEPIKFVIPGVQLAADDCIVLSLEHPAGALPDPEGLDQDQWLLCGNQAVAAPYGQGKAGTFGVPSLGSLLPPIPGQTVGIRMKGALPGADPILLVGFQPIAVPFDGGQLLVDPTLLLFLPTPVAGEGTLDLEWSVAANKNLCGASVYYQLMFLDPGAAGSFGLAMTNGLNHVYGW